MEQAVERCFLFREMNAFFFFFFFEGNACTNTEFIIGKCLGMNYVGFVVIYPPSRRFNQDVKRKSTRERNGTISS